VRDLIKDFCKGSINICPYRNNFILLFRDAHSMLKYQTKIIKKLREVSNEYSNIYFYREVILLSKRQRPDIRGVIILPYNDLISIHVNTTEFYTRKSLFEKELVLLLSKAYKPINVHSIGDFPVSKLYCILEFLSSIKDIIYFVDVYYWNYMIVRMGLTKKASNGREIITRIKFLEKDFSKDKFRILSKILDNIEEFGSNVYTILIGDKITIIDEHYNYMIIDDNMNVNKISVRNIEEFELPKRFYDEYIPHRYIFRSFKTKGNQYVLILSVDRFVVSQKFALLKVTPKFFELLRDIASNDNVKLFEINGYPILVTSSGAFLDIINKRLYTVLLYNGKCKLFSVNQNYGIEKKLFEFSNTYEIVRVFNRK